MPNKIRLSGAKSRSNGSASGGVKKMGWKKMLLLGLLAGGAMGSLAQESAGNREGESSVKQERELRQQVASLKKDIQKIDQNLKRTRELSQEEAKRFQTMKAGRERDAQNRRKEVAEMEAKIEEVKKNIAAEKSRYNRLKSGVKNAELREQALSEELQKACEALAAVIQSSIPWNREERVERVNTLKRDLENGSASYEEGFSRLEAIYQEETRQGDEVAYFNQSMVRADGEVITAHVLKIGNQWMVYMDEEGKKFGVLQRTAASDSGSSTGIQDPSSPRGPNGISPIYSWRENLSFQERLMVREAIEVKMAKKPPKLVKLPLTLSLQGGEE